MISIIGAGIGGLSAGIRLAAAGHDVTIFEKNTAVGGKMSQIEVGGYRWDTGPSVITMRHVFDELFAAAGKQLSDYIQLEPVAPLTRYFYPDGTILDASQDVEKMTSQLAQLDPRDAVGYQKYLDYVANLHRITGPVFIYDQPPTFKSFLRVPVTEWFKVDGHLKMAKVIKRYVHHPHIQQLLGRFATYVGASPYLAPGTLNVIAHVEMSGGVYYPKGGVYQVAAGMARLAQELGVKIRCGCGVAEILLKNGRISALRLENGETIASQTVISNVDVSTTHASLLPATTNQAPQEPSCSGFILLLGLDKMHPQLAHHNIFFSDNYPAEFDAIFKQEVPAQNPTIYSAITSKADPTHAPEGCENWFVLVNAPAKNSRFDWEAQKEAYRNLVLNRLAENHGIDIRPHIQVEQILTPDDLESGSGAWRGALYGASSNNMMAAFKRPHNRSKKVAGLYFAGGTTHPGGGVPMVTLSGKVAAELVLEDLK
ncbi:MAG: phytoene desaturase family protein [Chloroflexota bacterium]